MRKFLSGLISVFVLLSFNSCELDYYWERGNLNCDFYPNTNNYGNFVQTKTYYLDDIYIRSYPDFHRIRDIIMTDTWIEIWSDDFYAYSQGDYIEDLTISISGFGSFTFPVTPRFRNENLITIGGMNDSNYYDEFFIFMMDAIDYFYRRGSMQVTIRGKLRSVYLYDVNITLFNSLDVKLKDY
ncbi:MAG: hypothetical protein LUG18_08045 [Candidatus Azobacteroides sp.]|nr:hypothetical protein [Candidatus Azobacteroides sp.]